MANERKTVDIQDCGEIDDRPRHGCDRDAPRRRDLAWSQLDTARNDAPNSKLASGRHLGCGRSTPQHPVHVPGGPPAEDRAVACGEYGGHIPRLGIGSLVANAVDGSVLLNERSRPNPPIDRIRRHAKVEELAASDRPVLPTGKAGDIPIQRGN
jgi:hypothetical protein